MNHSSHSTLELAGSRSAEHGAALGRLFSRLWEVTDLPPQVMHLLALNSNEADSSAALLPIIERDQVVAARVLRRVNSARFGLGEEVTELSQAVKRLGVQELRNIALTAALGRLYSAGDPVAKPSGYSRDELWTYSVAVALTADLVAQQGLCVNRELAYAAGLLHDVGYLLLDQHLQSHYLRFVALARHRSRESLSTTDVEEQIFTFNHANLGGYAATHWGIPLPLCEAIEFHHRFEQYDGEHRNLLATLIVADWLCAEQGWTALGLARACEPMDRVFQAAQVSPATIDELRQQMPQILEQVPAAAALR